MFGTLGFPFTGAKNDQTAPPFLKQCENEAADHHAKQRRHDYFHMDKGWFGAR